MKAGGERQEGGILAHLDLPSAAELETGWHKFSGWCFHAKHKVRKVRLHLGEQSRICRYGLIRWDVAKAYPNRAHASHSGFEVELFVARGTYWVYLELELASGEVVRSQPLRQFKLHTKSLATRYWEQVKLYLWRSKTHSFQLLPGPQIETRKVGYRSTGEDPFFFLEGSMPRGWVEVLYRTTTPGFIRVRIYFDLGEGFNEAHATPLFGVHRGDSRGVAWLPPGIRALRFDVGSTKGDFVLEDLRFREIARTQLLFLGLRPHLLGLGRQPLSSMRKMAGLAVCGVRDGRDVLFHRFFPAQTNSYGEWIQLYDDMGDGRRQALKNAIAKMERTPLISVVLPTHNTPAKYLREAIQSVIDQVYPHWELCIADDGSTKPHVQKVLKELNAREPRIKVVYREHCGHISEASNTGLSMATGEFVTFLDHDDLLAPHALFRIVWEILHHPDVKLLYSDEDKIDALGHRHTPYFKPDWNPDLLLAQNYVCHLAVYRRTLLQQAGGLRKGFEGAQDHDLVLRCMDLVNRSEIRHIPEVLYHWREISGSTAMGLNEKPYAQTAGRRAIEEHLKRRRLKARVLEHGYYRVKFSLPEQPPLISLIIPTRDGLKLLKTCVESILDKTEYTPFELLIVDNQSKDPGTLSYLRGLAKHAQIRVLTYDAPFNFSAINNYAARFASGTLLGFINNDIEVLNGAWLEEMVSQTLRPEVGIVGAKLLYPNGTIQHAGVVLGVGGIAGHAFKHFRKSESGYFGRLNLVHNVSAVTAACMVMRKTVFEEVEGMNEENLAVAFNDVDLCLRVGERGYSVVWTPHATLIHHESVSRGYDLSPEKQARFTKEILYMEQRWDGLLRSDPYYNPNLTLEREDYTLAWKEREGIVLARPAAAMLETRPGKARPAEGKSPQKKPEAASLASSLPEWHPDRLKKHPAL